ncbi:MAG: tetratricopeptide repeat protein, partial [Myxococcales bacterium]
IGLLLAALLADATVVVKPRAGPPHGPSVLDRAGHALRALVEKPEPNVAEGNARAASGDVAGALEAYGKARVPEHGASAAALAHDRASALLRAGDARLAPQAVQEANRALVEGDAKLKAMAAYDLGYALEQSGRPDEAIAAYARALQLDPEDRDAKVNLELLLREEERKQKQPRPMGKQDEEKKQPQAGKDAAQKQQGPDQQRKGQEKQAGQDQQRKEEGQRQAGDAQQQGQASQQPQPDKGGEKKELQAAGNRPMDRSEAQRLLDALRAGEKNLQVWRFGKQKAKERRTDVEKDW